MKERKSKKRKSNQSLIKECFERDLSPQATIDFVIERAKKGYLSKLAEATLNSLLRNYSQLVLR